MEKQNFKVGDVVKLKSGGPEMTIKNIEGSLATCVYFDAENKKLKLMTSLLTLELAHSTPLHPEKS